MHINGAVWLSGRTIVSPLLAGGEKGTATVLTVKHVEPAPGARGSDV